MSEVNNAGQKGCIVGYGLIALLLFVILVVAIYYYNFRYLPA